MAINVLDQLHAYKMAGGGRKYNQKAKNKLSEPNYRKIIGWATPNFRITISLAMQSKILYFAMYLFFIWHFKKSIFIANLGMP